jgi:hypothetical protein
MSRIFGFRVLRIRSVAEVKVQPFGEPLDNFIDSRANCPIYHFQVFTVVRVALFLC